MWPAEAITVASAVFAGTASLPEAATAAAGEGLIGAGRAAAAGGCVAGSAGP